MQLLTVCKHQQQQQHQIQTKSIRNDVEREWNCCGDCAAVGKGRTASVLSLSLACRSPALSRAYQQQLHTIHGPSTHVHCSYTHTQHVHSGAVTVIVVQSLRCSALLPHRPFFKSIALCIRPLPLSAIATTVAHSPSPLFPLLHTYRSPPCPPIPNAPTHAEPRLRSCRLAHATHRVLMHADVSTSPSASESSSIALGLHCSNNSSRACS